MAAPLSITTNTGSQTTTGTPQPATAQSGLASDQSGNVQPGTATNLLTSSEGVPLHNAAVTTVSLAEPTQPPSASSTTTPPKLAPPNSHHLNPLLIGFSSLLLVVAIAMFWVIKRSAKNTTDYS